MKKIISQKEYKKLKKLYDPQKILNMHMMLKICLSSSQIDELIELRDFKNGKRVCRKH